MLHPKELQLVSSYFALGMRNWGVLFSRGWVGVPPAPQEAARSSSSSPSSRAVAGEGRRGADLDRKEAELRQDIGNANRLGVWIGS